MMALFTLSTLFFLALTIFSFYKASNGSLRLSKLEHPGWVGLEILSLLFYWKSLFKLLGTSSADLFSSRTVFSLLLAGGILKLALILVKRKKKEGVMNGPCRG